MAGTASARGSNERRRAACILKGYVFGSFDFYDEVSEPDETVYLWNENEGNPNPQDGGRHEGIYLFLGTLSPDRRCI